MKRDGRSFDHRTLEAIRLMAVERVRDGEPAATVFERSKTLCTPINFPSSGHSLRVMFEAVRWGERGARVNTISPGIIMTPLAKDELTGPRGAGYRRMIDGCPAKRAGTPNEVGNVAALLMGAEGAFITGSDLLMDGGATSSYWFGDLAQTAPK
jgi:hypothetical protein